MLGCESEYVNRLSSLICTCTSRAPLRAGGKRLGVGRMNDAAEQYNKTFIQFIIITLSKSHRSVRPRFILL